MERLVAASTHSSPAPEQYIDQRAQGFGSKPQECTTLAVVHHFTYFCHRFHWCRDNAGNVNRNVVWTMWTDGFHPCLHTLTTAWAKPYGLVTVIKSGCPQILWLKALPSRQKQRHIHTMKLAFCKLINRTIFACKQRMMSTAVGIAVRNHKTVLLLSNALGEHLLQNAPFRQGNYTSRSASCMCLCSGGIPACSLASRPMSDSEVLWCR